MVLENSAFHGDMALHFPDSYHKFYDNDEAFRRVLSWCVKFSNDTKLYDEISDQMLNLVSLIFAKKLFFLIKFYFKMAQELDILPKSETFVNPYKYANAKKNVSFFSKRKRKKTYF
jgi:hypothetical protein